MKPIERDYHLTDGNLIIKCEDVLDSIDRDITEFTDRGYTPAKKDAFEDAIADFDALPGDNYLLGQQEIATEAKDALRTVCETKINAVLTGVVNVWGIESSHYHLFTENKPVSQLTDAALYRFLEDFADSTEDHLTDLAGEGIDAATVTELRNSRDDFNTGLKNQRKAIKARDIGNSERIKKGNTLYKLLVAHCNTGKNIWLNVDEAKHNDYVIYDTPSGSDTAGYDVQTFIVPSGGGSVIFAIAGTGIPASLDVYLKALDGSAYICSTNLPVSPCGGGSSYLLEEGIRFKGVITPLNLDLTKTHIQFTNPGLTDVTVKAGTKNV